MLIRRFYDERLAQASFLVACQRTGEAIVVDPARDVRQYIDAARSEQVRITRVTETHIHADFLSGTRELAHRTGAIPHLSGAGGSEWQYRFAEADGATLLRDGDVIEMGGVRISVRHTPGHTPEHLSFVITDTARSTEPVAMLSGDFIFVGDVGRPDLLERAANVADTMRDGARDLYRSLERTRDLPDHLQLWPGHGAGSACGKALGAMPSSTLGYERRTNWAFGVADEATFIDSVLEGQPNPPTYFGVMKQLNRDGAPLLSDEPLRQMAAADLDDAMDDGLLIDIRPVAESSPEHVRGALRIPLGKSFTTWAGWLVPRDRDLYLLSATTEAASDARCALQSIGLDRVRGAFGAEALAVARSLGNTGATERVPMAEVMQLQAGGRTIIDVREANEWGAGHLADARHAPLGSLAADVDSLDRHTPIAVHCQGGMRSAIAASVLERAGFTDVIDLAGGWGAWERR